MPKDQIKINAERIAQMAKSLVSYIDRLIGITNAGNIGFGARLINKTGVPSVKGTIIEASPTTDFAFKVCDGNCVESFGIVYDDGIVDGERCLVIFTGYADVLLKDATASTRANWVEVSDVAGRADATSGSPAAAPQHFQEIGHCIESKGAGTDVLSEIAVHFL